jgi:cobalt-zinc-cadmium efflux system membrane fusion protein
LILRTARKIPTLLILLGLGGVAYWGHVNDWTVPKFAQLLGQTAETKDDWCEAHAVPESLCVECNASLLPKAKPHGWCRAHGVHNCPLEHPDVAQLPTRPTVKPEDLERARRALAVKDRPENNSKCGLYQHRIQFASDEAMAKAGVDVRPAWQAPVMETLSTSGEVGYEKSRVAKLATPVSGRVWRVTEQGNVGRAVKRGDVLALIDAAEVGKAKAEFLQAFAQFEVRSTTLSRLDKVYTEGAVSEVKYRETEAARREAEIRLAAAQQTLINLGLPIRADEVKGLATPEVVRRLRFLGLPPAVARSLDPETTTANLIPVVSSLDGVLVAREAADGEVVDGTKILFVVADTRRMWLTLNVRLGDVRYLSLGQRVLFWPDDGTRGVGGTLNWISTRVDEKTRTVEARAEAENVDGMLRAGAFGSGRIVLRTEPRAVVVPSEAVHWEGCCHVVFVRDKDFLRPGSLKVFHVREVRPGVRDAQQTEIIAGLLPGEVVATRGTAALRAQLLKNNLGAG